jgi:IS30 family transposase
MRAGQAKLTDEKVLEIRKLCTEGTKTQAELARQFFVRQSTISKIIHRQRWTHI